MKYYSEILDKFFDTDKECIDAEKAESDKNKRKEQSARKAEVDEAFSVFNSARDELKSAQDVYSKAKANYNKLKVAYVNDYGYYADKDGVAISKLKTGAKTTTIEVGTEPIELEKLARILGII